MVWTGAAAAGITAGASLLGGLLGGSSAKQAQDDANKTNVQLYQDSKNWQQDMWAKQNQANIDFQTRQNVASANLAREDREWQERMSNTAYTRAVADMKNAGINPMLAFMKGGASTPGGATGSAVGGSSGSVSAPSGRVIPATAKGKMLAQGLRDSVSSAIDTRRLIKEIEVAGSVKGLNEAAEDAQKALEMEHISNAKRIDAETMILKQDYARRRRELPSLFEKYDYEQKKRRYDKNMALYDAVAERIAREVRTGATIMAPWWMKGFISIMKDRSSDTNYERSRWMNLEQ